jgi:WD40 repeat protein
MIRSYVFSFFLLILITGYAQKPELILPVGHMGNVHTVSFSGDGKYVLASSDDHTAKIWDVPRGRLLHSLEGHTDNIYSAVFSSDSGRVITVSRDKTVKIWDWLTGELIHSSLSPVTFGSTKLFPDGKTILANSETRSGESVCLWDTRNENWTLVYSLRGTIISRSNPFPCSPDNKCFAFISYDESLKESENKTGELKIADTKTGKVIHTLDKFITDNLNSGDFSPDGRYFLTASDESIKIWDIEAEKLISSIPWLGYFVFSKDGKKIATISSDTSNTMIGEPGAKTVVVPPEKSIIKICEIPSGKVLYVIEPNRSSGKPLDLCFSPDGTRLLIADYYGYVIHDIRTGKNLFAFEGGGPAAFSPDGKTMITSANTHLLPSPSDDLVPKLWDTQSGKQLHRLEGHTGNVYHAKFSPDGSKILTNSWPSIARLWDIKNGKILNRLKGDKLSYNSVEFSPDGNYILTTAPNETAIIWNVIDGKQLFSMKGDTSLKKIRYGAKFSAIFSPDSKVVVTSYNDNQSVKVYDIETRRLKFTLTCSVPVNVTAFNTDGSELAVASGDGTARIWDLKNGLLKFVINDADSSIDNISANPPKADYKSGFSSIVFSPDGKHIVTKSEINLKMWDAMTGKLIYRPADYITDISSSPFSPDSKILAADFYNLQGYSVKGLNLQTELIDVSSGKVIDTLSGYTVIMNGILKTPFNPGGDKILTLSMDNNFKLWDRQSGKLLFKLGWDDPKRIAGSAFFSPNGKFILTSSFHADTKGYIIKYEPLDLWSIETGKALQTINIGSAKPGDINWKHSLVNSIQNSKVGLYDIKSGKEKVSFVAIDNDDYVFLLPTGEYMGTSGGVKYLSWRLNNKLYDFDQWDLQYNRPDKVLEQLGNTDTSLIYMYRKAYLKRLKKAGFTEEMFTAEWHTPESRILNAEDFAVPVSDARKQLKVSFSDSRYKLDRLNVWINDVPIAGKNGISLRKNSARSIIKDIPLTLSEGPNKIQVSCTNEKGVESLKEAIEVIYNPISGKKPDLYIIAMSVSTYKDYRYSLQYPVKDGRDLVSMFRLKGTDPGRFKKIHIDTLFDANATKEKFFALKQNLIETNVNDELVVFISGHGLLDENLDFYFATYDIDFNNPSKRGISFDQMESLLDSIPARKKLLMMDACHSGEVDKDELNEPVASVSAGTTDYAMRGNIKTYSYKGIDSQTNPSGITLNNSFDLMQELFTGLDKGTGTTVISAAAGDGYALESPQWNNGVFTYSIINGLKNRAADKNGDDIITISELKDYSIKQVQLLTGGRQKPTARKESINYDWEIW